MSTSDHNDRLGLERFDTIEAPDQWTDILQRAEAGGHAGSDVVTLRRHRGWYLAAAASFVALIGGLVVVTQLRGDDGATPIDQPGTGVADMTGCADESELDTIVEILRSGLPLYDYQPAADLDELVGQNDVVVRARLTRAARDAGPAPADLGDLGLTTVSLSSVDVLSGDLSTVVDGFETASQWAVRDQSDPLAEPVTFDRLEVIAFLSMHNDVPSGWTPDIEGWFVACDGGPARGVIETPTFLDLTSLDALEAQITGVDPDTTPTTEPAPTDTSTPTTSPTTEPDDTVPETAAADERWTPTCVDQFGSGGSPSPDDGLDEFGPLGAVPGLDIELPAYRSPEQTGPGDVTASVGRVDGGVAVLTRPAEGEDTAAYVMSVVDDDGSVRWRRCVDDAFGSSMLSSTNADLLVVSEYQPGTQSGPLWRVFDLTSGRDAGSFDRPDEMQTVTVGGRYALFSMAGDQPTTQADEMVLLDLTTNGYITLSYPDMPDVPAFRFEFEVIENIDDGVRILVRVDGSQSPVIGVWADDAWQTDPATILAATPLRAVLSFDERGWEGRNGLGEVVWSRPDLLDIRREGFLSDVSDTVTVINACLEQSDAGCDDGNLVGVNTATGETLWERVGNRGVSAVGDGFAIITNDAGDGWEMIDTLTGDLVDESQQWAGIEPFSQECCGAGDFIWVGRDGGVVFAVNQDHVRVWYPQDRSDTTINVSLMD